MISCNITYYNEPNWLIHWYKKFRLLYEQGHDIILNIADDGSLISPASAFFKEYAPMPNMHLFRVKEDLGFNSHGARNLLMNQTTSDWNILSDIDRAFPKTTLINIINKENNLQKGRYYLFQELQKATHDGFSHNEFLIHKNDFWKTGGYDEEYVNIHYGDRDFLKALQYVVKKTTIQEWKVDYLRKARKVSYDINVEKTTYPDDQTLIHPNKDWGRESYRLNLKKFVTERNKTHEGRMSKKVINFEWEQVF